MQWPINLQIISIKTYSCNNASRAAELHSQYLTRRREYQGLPLTEDSFSVSGVAYSWIRSYLDGRTQFVRMGS